LTQDTPRALGWSIFLALNICLRQHGAPFHDLLFVGICAIE